MQKIIFLLNKLKNTESAQLCTVTVYNRKPQTPSSAGSISSWETSSSPAWPASPSDTGRQSF